MVADPGRRQRGARVAAARVKVKPAGDDLSIVVCLVGSTPKIYGHRALGFPAGGQDSEKMDAPAPATAPAPVVTAVADARFCAPVDTAFAVTKTISLTGRDFTVTDAAGAAAMQVEAAVFALLRKSLLLDAARRPVLTMQHSGYFMDARWEVFRGDSTSRRNLLFAAAKSSAFQIRTKIYVFLAGNAAGEEAPDFVIRGSYYDGACTVCRGSSDAAIAQITRQNTAGGALLGRHTYTARISPGIDRAFILALTVILDEMHHHR